MICKRENQSSLELEGWYTSLYNYLSNRTADWIRIDEIICQFDGFHTDERSEIELFYRE